MQLLLSKYSGQSDIVVGTPSANRSRAELAPLIGFLVNTLPIRTDLSGDPSFRQLLHRVRDRTVAAYAHQDIPFAKLVEALQIERDPSRTPVFQVSFAHAETAPEPLPAAGLLVDIFEDYPDPDTAKFDLALFIGTNERSFELVVQYALDLFEQATAHRLLGHLGQLLAELAADPDAPISQLSPLTEAELYDELVRFNETATELPTGCVHQLFEAQVRRSPQAPAASFAGQSVSYTELNRQANQIARWLLATGAGGLVGVAMTPSIQRLATVLAVLKVGAGYVPLDPALPAERRKFMETDAQLSLVLTDELLAAGSDSIGQLAGQNLDLAGGSGRCCLRDLHLRFHRPAQGGGGRASAGQQLRDRDGPARAGRIDRPGLAVRLVEFRRVGAGHVRLPAGRRLRGAG